MSENEAAGDQAAVAQTEENTHIAEGSQGRVGEATAARVAEHPFDRAELAQFDSDDADAGRHIGKMLSLFFLYTVIAMSIVAWWTYSTITEQ